MWHPRGITVGQEGRNLPPPREENPMGHRKGWRFLRDPELSH